MKKKLLIATDNFLPRWDGVSRFLIELIPFIKDKYDITILAPDFGKVNISGVKIIKFGLSNFRFGDYTFAKVDKKILKDAISKCDFVFCQTLGPVGIRSIREAKKNKKKVISFCHSLEWELVPRAIESGFLKSLMQPLIRFFIRFLYNKIDLIICPSESIKELLSWSGMKSRKVVVNLGVSHNLFCPLSERDEESILKVESLREKYGLSGCFVIGNHGRLAREKDLRTLIRAFNWLRKKYDNVKLVVVGDGLDSIKKRLESVEDVIVVPKSDEVYYYLNLFDCYVTSSTTETTSLATLEAMSSGVCPISTPVGFIGEYIVDNKNGFLFPVGNAFMLYKYIEILKNNITLKNSVSLKARRTIVKKFSWDNTAKGIKDSFNLLLKD
ncbi:MAG: glycosyltransferase family 4 protein, partial [Candidatus Woesearchaeota archaeon]